MNMHSAHISESGKQMKVDRKGNWSGPYSSTNKKYSTFRRFTQYSQHVQRKDENDAAESEFHQYFSRILSAYYYLESIRL